MSKAFVVKPDVPTGQGRHRVPRPHGLDAHDISTLVAIPAAAKGVFDEFHDTFGQMSSTRPNM